VKRRLWIFAILALLAAALYVPRISAYRYRDNVRAALEKGLGRKVDFSDVRFRLLPTPGITLTDVVIGEDPAIGAEPFAYVKEVVAVPRITSLLGRPLAFASIDLSPADGEASVNLTRVDKADGVRWNFASLLRPATLQAFPSVHLSGGRINFKFGDTKSLVYMMNTDVDLWPPNSDQGAWTLRVHADPARTDRRAGNGFGNFVARGQWLPRNNATTLDVKLEKSELGDILTLINGYESGLHGEVSGDAHLAGPINRIGIAGRLTVADVHGWNQTPPGGNAWRFAIGGAIDLAGQTVDLNAKTVGVQSPLAVRYRVTDYLRRPRWGVTVNVNHFPLAPLPDIARNLGFSVPADFKFDGTVDGAVGFSVPAGAPRMDGALSLSNATFIVRGTPPLQMPGATLNFSGSAVSLAAAAIMNEAKETAEIAGSWDMDTRRLDVQLSSDGMSIASLKRQISVAGIPLLGSATSGTWKGSLRYRADGLESGPRDAQSGWSGGVTLKDADIPFEAFAAPLHIESADASIDGAGLALKRVSLSIGSIEALGEYRYEAGAPRPHKFRIAVPQTSAAELEKLLMPALHRGNLLSYAFSFGRTPEPDWLRNMKADGVLQANRLDVDTGFLSNLRARILWDGTDVQLTGLETQFGDAAFRGSARIHLAGRQPRYELTGKMAGFAWHGGTITADGKLTTSGTGTDLVTNLHAQGKFDGRNLDDYDSVTGTFDWAWDARTPKLRLPTLVMKSATDNYLGSGEMGDNGELKRVQAAGALKPAP
jgi:hypothetical protein